MHVYAAPNGLPLARAGYALPGLRGAVERNRLRRRLREALRPQLAARPGFDLVVVAGPDALNVPFADLSTDLTAAVAAAVERAGRRTAPPPPRRGGRATAQNEGSTPSRGRPAARSIDSPPE